MENRSHAMLAGAFTLLLLVAIFCAGWWMLRERQGNVLPYEIATKLPIPGLREQAYVRFHGLNVGRVTSIRFNPDVMGEILIRIDINAHAPVTNTTYATLGQQGITGLSFIELNGSSGSQHRLETSEEKPAHIEMKPSVFSGLDKRIVNVMDDLQKASTSLNRLLDDKNQKEFVGAIKNIGDAAKNVSILAQKAEPAISRMPDIAERTDNMMESLVTLSGSVNELSTSINTFIQRDVENDTLPRLNALMEQARTSAVTFNNTLEQLNQKPMGLFLATPAPLPGPGESGFVPPKQ